VSTDSVGTDPASTGGTDAPFSSLTTFRVGGPASHIVRLSDPDTLTHEVLDVWGSGEDWLVLGGGSNVLVSDEGFPGVVLHVVTRGIERLPTPDRPGVVALRVQAGEPWDALVAHTVERGWAGLEALSGIPGSTGASPIQNIGAYGQEVAQTLTAVEFLDYLSGDGVRIPAPELGFGYRTSIFKRGRQGIVTAVEFELVDGTVAAGGSAGPGAAAGPGASGSALSQPVAYPQLARALGVELGARVPLADVRSAVLALRASKGMVLNDADTDTWSAGSFFTNPIVTEHFARTLPADAPRWPVEHEVADRVIELVGDHRDAYAVEDAVLDLNRQRMAREASGGPDVKLSAAWLIEHAGVRRGFRLPGSAAAISSKHTLALTNTGDATADQIAELARYVQGRVLGEFGILLHPEPQLVNLTL
jgi:UDP-N-acetylmuramate dehydrogenase